MKTINKTFSVTKDTPQDAPDDLLWVWASVEITDSMGDVISIAGLNWNQYHNPPDTYLKILAGHARELPDGTPAIVGRVERIMKTVKTVDGKTVPALAIGISFAKDGDGNLLPLAKAYKDLIDGGYLDSFSVGIMVLAYDETRTGLNITKSELFEVSACAIPANASANVIKVIGEKLAAFGMEVEKPATGFIQHFNGGSWVSVADHNRICDAMASTFEKALPAVQPYDPDLLIAKSIESMWNRIDPAVQQLTKANDALVERLEVLESILVVKSAEAQKTDDRMSGRLTKELSKELEAKLQKIAKFLDN